MEMDLYTTTKCVFDVEMKLNSGELSKCQMPAYRILIGQQMTEILDFMSQAQVVLLLSFRCLIVDILHWMDLKLIFTLQLLSVFQLLHYMSARKHVPEIFCPPVEKITIRSYTAPFELKHTSGLFYAIRICLIGMA
jgi:hypothetical protein